MRLTLALPLPPGTYPFVAFGVVVVLIVVVSIVVVSVGGGSENCVVVDGGGLGENVDDGGPSVPNGNPCLTETCSSETDTC